MRTEVAAREKHTTFVLCNCKACEDCDRQYCFRLRQPAPDASDESYFLVVEHKGTCTSKKDLLQRKLQLAREYALQHSPARAIKKGEGRRSACPGVAQHGAAEKPAARRQEGDRLLHGLLAAAEEVFG